MFTIKELQEKSPFLTYDCKGVSLGKLLGKGANANVYLIKIDDTKYAAKVYEDRSDIDDEFISELDIAYSLKGAKHSVQVHGVGYIQKDESYDILLLMEYLVSHGDLYDYIQEVAKWTPSYLISNKLVPNPKNNYIYYNEDYNTYWCYELPESQKIRITKSMVEGVKELHSYGIIHGDIKTNNMVLQYCLKKQILKLVDFGMAYPTETDDCIEIYYKCGTVGYLAPEQDNYEMCYRSDVYSMGITIIELWNGDIWIDKDDFNGCRREAFSGLRKIEANNKRFGKLLRDSISLNYKKRPTAKRFLERFNNIFNNDRKYKNNPQH